MIGTHRDRPRRRKPSRQVIHSPRKRESFAEAKQIALAEFLPGVIVELRGDSETGGIIERVRLEATGPNGYRWVQAFET